MNFASGDSGALSSKHGTPNPQEATRWLLARMGLGHLTALHRLRYHGADPVIASPLAYGCASASALGAHALAIAELWRLRTGRTQAIDVDLKRAVMVGLRSIFLLRQNGHGFSVGGNSRKVRNFFRTRDGRLIYLLRMFDYPNIVPALLGVLKCPNTLDDITRAVAGREALELENALAEARAFGVISRSPAEWLAHPQGAWLTQRPGLEIRKISATPPVPLPPGDRPLAGLKVLDASHVIAGPATGRTLAEHGAQVLRVSGPHQPDAQQMVIDLGFGKRHAFLNLDDAGDVNTFKQLAASADVLIESWRPGALRRRGLGPQDLAALNPRLIQVSISCYGDEGPWATRGGYEPIGQVACGLAASEGTSEEPQLAPTVTMNDYLAAYLAAAGVAAALVRRTTEGGGYHVSTSLTQASMWVLQQGRLEAGAQPADLDGAAPLPPNWFRQSSSVFGDLHHAAPIAEFSETSPYWEIPPQPLGASHPAWL